MNKAGTIRAAAKGNFEYLCLEALLEEVSIVGVRSCEGLREIDPI